MTEKASQGSREPFKVSAIFLITIGISGLIIVWGIANQDSLLAATARLQGFALFRLNWFFLFSSVLFLLILIGLAISPWGKIRLGGPDAKPEFSLISWLAMLFSAGMGAGLLFWAAGEPAQHAVNKSTPLAPAFGGEQVGPEEAKETMAKRQRHALKLTNLHWGLHAWGIYAFSGLCLAYFGFNRRMPLVSSAPIEGLLPGAVGKSIGGFADVLAVLAVVFGLAGSLGGGVIQISQGLGNVMAIQNGALALFAILLLLTIAYMISASTSLDKGIKILSNVNLGIAVALLMFVFVCASVFGSLGRFAVTTWDYLLSVLQLPIQLYVATFDSDASKEWVKEWTLSFFMWWIAWAPFVGIFIARISRGRTIRQFALGTILMPSLFSLFWFSVFGQAAFGLGEPTLQHLADDGANSLFVLLREFPLTNIVTWVSMCLVFTFLVTSADSASFVLGMMTSSGSLDPPRHRKLIWGTIVALLTGVLLAALFKLAPANSISQMKAFAMVGAVPFCAIMIVHGVCLIKSLATDSS